MGSLWCAASALEFKRTDDVAPRMRPFLATALRRSPRAERARLVTPPAEHFLREVRELAASAQ
jgi:hypothetical protein